MIRRSLFILITFLPLVAGAEPAEKGVEELASLGLAANGAVKPSLTPLASELLGEGGAPALPSLDQSADQSLADFALPLPADLPESDIPLAMNDKVARFIQHFQTDGREAFSRWLSRSERYIPSMREVLRQRGLPEDLVYLAMIESGFAPDAYSCARAAGPWQFMPQTAKGFSLRIDPWIDERRDPVKSTVAAAMYLKELYVLFDQDWYLAAAGYNAGENKVLRAIRRYKSRDFWKLAERSYLKRETRDYVPKLLAAAIIAKEPAKYGFADVAYLTPIEFDTVTIPEQTDLEVVARLCNVSEETIRELNPEILLWCTPPNSDNYELKIPKGSRQAFLDAYSKLSPGERYSERLIFSRYRVKRGESLKSLARKFSTTTRQLADINGLTRRKRLTGTTILVPISIANLEAVTIGTGKEGGRRAYVRAHIVSKGESLKGLARRYNVSPKTLAAWNGLSLAKPLKPGKRLIVVRYVAASGSLVYERQGS